ncbi:hypothetical protein BRYFOR_06427 [Marvinbryantia formatexigens DSM 14469]|uniref:Uncharacterized protein n=1 Tax=Marvinbryantia formatexigens DSM 14469 TaxID=478749 RepID=C6LCT0_9FIRM|nr:hypothetical protein [Marvinbryantia formatexigens]EET61744.1 hypothetical protein BRYFOR_06427 [Marvinbryantia formatexigens DSM 14469]
MVVIRDFHDKNLPRIFAHGRAAEFCGAGGSIDFTGADIQSEHLPGALCGSAGIVIKPGDYFIGVSEF